MTSAVHRFAAFELDTKRRALRLAGREVPLQPRVFDLLSYLVEHRDRVVSKEELLDALWPGVVVTESSLQRAVSLARGALRSGGLEDAIRNYARHGYRFQTGASGDAPGPGGGADARTGTALARAQVAFEQARWRDAVDAYAAADREQPLDADALERWGIAAQCAGDLPGAMGPLERAAVAHSSRGAREQAARALISLARIQIESLDIAVTQGCLRRAERLLSGLPQGEQHGHLAWMTARFHLYKGELAEAIRLAQRARDIGHEHGIVDVEAMGALLWGIGLQASGDAKSGMALQDEAAAAVLAGDVSPLVGGIIYCGIISSCCNGGDWLRAGQWTESFTRWCQRSGIDTFAGACLVHQAEVLAMSGRLERAREAIRRADPLIRVGAPWALGDAYRLMGDVHLARGETDEAERAFQHAYQHGWDPHPGYAELLHQRGRDDEAIRSLERAAALTNWVAGERRAGYLSHAAQIAALSGRLDKARSLIRELDDDSPRWEHGAVAGQVDRARAEIAWSEGRIESAQQLLHRAVDLLQHRGALMDAARARVRLAELLALQGDAGTARMELGAAEAVFQAAGAEAYLAQCRSVRSALSGGDKAED